MHQARIAIFLLGAWIFGGLFMAYVASQNIDMVDTVLKSPSSDAAKFLQKLGPNNNPRQLLYYLASEEIRSVSEDWELAQIGIGVLLMFVLLLGLENKLLTGVATAMVILTVFEHFKVTPELSWLGRSIDFIPWAAESQQRDQYWKLRTVYNMMDVLKLILALGMTGYLFTLRRKRVKPRMQVDPVDYANHRHVDR